MKGSVLIAGTHSGCGKTTITLGVLAALRRKGFSVQSFKAGPDFIDAGLHRLITGRPSRNLDLWMCGEEYVKACFYRYSRDVDISVVEGVMGMYDGNYNTARLAQVLGVPVILVVDAYGMAESAGAIVKGFREYESSNIAGVIFNRVASERHYERLKLGVRDVEVLGYLPGEVDFEIPHRHLGLVVAEEQPISQEKIDRLAMAILEYIDIERVIEITKSLNLEITKSQNHSITKSPNPRIRIAVAYDRAFSFYYEDNLDLLKEAGAEIVRFSPLRDYKIPDDVDALYIGGGYPELCGEALSRNRSMLGAIHDWAHSGKPVYAECGGMMYLSEGIYDLEGRFFKMAGILPFETAMKERPHLGYREVQLKGDCILGRSGDILRGHEFHYSDINFSTVGQPSRLSLETVYSLKNNNGDLLYSEGYKFKNVLASYVHIHFGSNPAIAENFIKFVRSLKR